MEAIRKSQDEIKDLRKEINEFKVSLEFVDEYTILKWILILSMIY